MGGLGKDFGSMNMDELLMNIWSAEETQGITSTSGAGEGNAPVGNLQRQGSLTLPRTLSQKTVDDVWKEMNRESGDVKFGNVGGGSDLPQEQRQQTLGEMTLEEFLARAGVVREDAQEMQRQGSLTLPRTLSQKTVDDVWKEMNRESGDVKFGNVGGGSDLPQEQRQQTLGEMTLEEFLARAGVVREDAQEMQRQGSLTLPRMLSQKTVDDVWKEMNRESGDVKFGNVGGGSDFPQEQRQQTLGAMTLEEFLARAGVVQEDAQEMARPGNSGFFGELFRHSNNNTGLALGFQQASRNNGLLGSRVESNNNSVPHQSRNLALNVGGVRTHQLPPQQQQPIFPKPATLSFAPSMHLVSNAQLTSPRSRGPMSAVVEPSRNTAFSQGGGFPGAGIGMGGLGAGGITVASRSPVNKISPDVIVKSSADTSSLSPVPYMFTRGRKANGALEKVVERRQRRMIKNRESAARSRARKQAYTLELEAEVQKLKEMNEELQKKQAEIMEMQKDQILETMKREWGGKRRCLRRTLTGPW